MLAAAKKLVIHLNGIDIVGAQEFLTSTSLNDPKKYNKEKVNLKFSGRESY